MVTNHGIRHLQQSHVLAASAESLESVTPPESSAGGVCSSCMRAASTGHQFCLEAGTHAKVITGRPVSSLHGNFKLAVSARVKGSDGQRLRCRAIMISGIFNTAAPNSKSWEQQIP